MASHATGDGGIPPRDAAERGLKRVMTLGGAYGTRNYTVKDLPGVIVFLMIFAVVIVTMTGNGLVLIVMFMIFMVLVMLTPFVMGQCHSRNGCQRI